MSDTDSLIDKLASSGAAPRGGSLLHFTTPLVAVGLICTLGAILFLEDAFASIDTHGFSPMIVKWGFSLAVLLLSAFALWAIGRPGRRSGGATRALAVPFALVAALVLLELLVGKFTFPGATWKQCLVAMAVMSPVAFIGAILAARWLAPTNLRRAGLAAGLFGGAVAMTAYSPFCPEHGMLYLAVFYCLPILAMAGLGWLLGPRLLRW